MPALPLLTFELSGKAEWQIFDFLLEAEARVAAEPLSPTISEILLSRRRDQNTRLVAVFKRTTMTGQLSLMEEVFSELALALDDREALDPMLCDEHGELTPILGYKDIASKPLGCVLIYTFSFRDHSTPLGEHP